MEELKKKIEKYIKVRGWSILENPGSIAKSISIESAELLEVFQWKDMTPEEIKKNKEVLQNVREELADIFIYATEMAISLDLDIETIMNQKLAKNAKKYPAKLVKGNQENYLKIKREVRNKKQTKK